MNRHIVIGFKKGSSFKDELGEVVGLAPSIKEAKKLASKNIGNKGKKFAYCGIIAGKRLCASVGDKSAGKRNIITFGKGPKDIEAEEANKEKEPEKEPDPEEDNEEPSE